MTAIIPSPTRLQWRAMHSFAIDAACRQEDPEISGHLLSQIGGTLVEFVRHFDDGTLATSILVDNVDPARVYVRILVRNDVGGYEGLCHPPADELGIDGAVLKELVSAHYAETGQPVDQFDVVQRSANPDDFDLVQLPNVEIPNDLSSLDDDDAA